MAIIVDDLAAPLQITRSIVVTPEPEQYDYPRGTTSLSVRTSSVSLFYRANMRGSVSLDAKLEPVHIVDLNRFWFSGTTSLTVGTHSYLGHINNLSSRSSLVVSPSAKTLQTSLFSTVETIPDPAVGSDLFADAPKVNILKSGDTYTSLETDSTGYTLESGELSYYGDKTVWWRYTPTTSGLATFDTELSPDLPNAYLILYQGVVPFSVGTARFLSVAQGQAPKISWYVTAGITYFIRVSNYSSTPATYVLRVVGPPTVVTTPVLDVDLDISASSMEVLYYVWGNSSLVVDLSNRGGFKVFSDRQEVYTLETRLYEPDGKTFVCVLPKARNVQFQMENDKPGTAHFELPLHDESTSLVTDDMIVKFAWRGKERFGCVVSTSECTQTVDGTTWIKYDSQPGLMSLLTRAVVMPEYLNELSDPIVAPPYWLDNVDLITALEILGDEDLITSIEMPRNGPDERLFGYMSKPAGWYLASDWVKPMGEPWNTLNSAKGQNPAVFQTVGPTAQWIAAPPGPNVAWPRGTTQYFRSEFSIEGDNPLTVFVYAAGDNFATAYVDGEVVMEPDMKQPLSWQHADMKKMVLWPGKHIIAGHVLNAGAAAAPPLSMPSGNVNILSPGNPVGGVSLKAGDRILLKYQTNPAEKGSYIFDTATTPLIKPSDVNTIGFISSIVFMSVKTGQPAPVTIEQTLSGDILFDLGKYKLKPAAITALNGIIDQIYGDKPVVKIEGHASTDGAWNSNQTLSTNRANAVKTYIKSRKPSAVITAVGYGESKPKYRPGTSAQNRRVVITYPKATPGVTAGSIPAPSVIRQTDTTNWLANDGYPVPGWYRASVIKKLIEEAKEQGIKNFDSISIGFNDTYDTSHIPWQKRGQYKFALATTNLLDVVQTLAEDELDVELDAESMEIRAWLRRGHDLTTGDLAVRLFIGHGLKDYVTKRDGPKATTVLARMVDGTWVELRDRDTYYKYGRRVVGLTVNSAMDTQSATDAAQTLLDELSKPTITITAKTSAFNGPQPFRDWNVGDTVLVPGHDGVGLLPARCISITVDNSKDEIEIWSEFVHDLTSAFYPVIKRASVLWRVVP